jgi:hypothetical protein
MADPRACAPTVEATGEALHESRVAYMIGTNQGLTKTYNALKDPNNADSRILELRQLHEAMDRAVLDAYGWTNIAVPPYCPLSDADRAAVQAFEDEVIDRLYVLNAERAREEERLGLAAKGGARRAAEDDDPAGGGHDGSPDAAPKKKTAKKKATNKDQGKLF